MGLRRSEEAAEFSKPSSKEMPVSIPVEVPKSVTGRILSGMDGMEVGLNLMLTMLRDGAPPAGGWGFESDVVIFGLGMYT